MDDNVVNRRVARTLLQSYDFDIDEAESGEGAIQLVRGKLYDIIFMDHMMPQMDGIEAVQIIRKDCGENGSLPVIIALTANAMGNIRETFLNNGFQDFIAKPLDRRMLHKTLQRWIPEEKRKPSGSWGGSGQDDGSHTQYKDIFIEGIDTDELAEHYSGSMEEYKSLLDLYCLDGKRKLKLLRELLERGDYQTYGIEVHALKSASANVGAMKISEIAREQERAVKRGDETFVDSHAEQLLAGYEEQIGHIKDFLAESGRTDEKTQESGNEIETAELVRELREALESLEHFRAKKCAGKVDDILQYRLSDNVKRKLVEIKEQLKLYEDDAAEQLLRDLIEEIEKEES